MAIPGVFVGARHGFSWGAALAILSGGAAYLLLGQPGLFLIAMALPIFLLGSLAVRKVRRSFDGLVLMCGAMVLSVGAGIFSVQQLLGKDLVSYIVDYLAWAFPNNADLAALAYSLFHAGEISTGVLSIETFLALPMEEIVAYVTAGEQLNALRSLLSDFLPVLSVNYCVFGGAATYFCARAFSKNRRPGGQCPRILGFLFAQRTGALYDSAFCRGHAALAVRVGTVSAHGGICSSALQQRFLPSKAWRLQIFAAHQDKNPYGRGAIIALIYAIAPYLLMTAGAVEQGMQLRRRIKIVKQ